MPYKRRVVIHPDGNEEVFHTRISEEGFQEWLVARDRLREEGRPDRPPDIDTETTMQWLRHPGEEHPHFDAWDAAMATDFGKAFSIYSATFADDSGNRVIVTVEGQPDGGTVIRAAQLMDGDPVDEPLIHGWAPQTPDELVDGDLTALLVRAAELGNPKVTTYDDYEAVEHELEAARLELEQLGFLEPAARGTAPVTRHLRPRPAPASRVIRVDPDVYARLKELQRPDESLQAAVTRIVNERLADEDPVGTVCCDCPTWMWDEQPHGTYGIERHEAGTIPHDGHPHPWRGGRIVRQRGG